MDFRQVTFPDWEKELQLLRPIFANFFEELRKVFPQKLESRVGVIVDDYGYGINNDSFADRESFYARMEVYIRDIYVYAKEYAEAYKKENHVKLPAMLNLQILNELIKPLPNDFIFPLSADDYGIPVFDLKYYMKPKRDTTQMLGGSLPSHKLMQIQITAVTSAMGLREVIENITGLNFTQTLDTQMLELQKYIEAAQRRVLAFYKGVTDNQYTLEQLREDVKTILSYVTQGKIFIPESDALEAAVYLHNQTLGRFDYFQAFLFEYEAGVNRKLTSRQLSFDRSKAEQALKARLYDNYAMAINTLEVSEDFIESMASLIIAEYVEHYQSEG